MSAEALVWGRKLLPLLANDSQRVVILDFCLRASPDGLLWPSIADVCMELGKSDRAIRRTIRELDREELLNVSADFRNDGSQGSNYYQLLLSVTPQELLKRRRSRIVIMSTSARKRFQQRMERLYGLIECWAAALSTIRVQINPRTFDSWYTPLKFRGINKHSLILGVPNNDFEEYFKDRRIRNLIIDAAKPAFLKQNVTVTSVYFTHHKSDRPGCTTPLNEKLKMA